MRFLAKRRWFRFRLSTVLIATAITAWAMSCWPWIAFENVVVGSPEGSDWSSGYYGLAYSLTEQGVFRLSINRRFAWSTLALTIVALWWLNNAIPRSTQPFWRKTTQAPAKRHNLGKLSKFQRD
jgi:hypothetical protein